MSTVLDNIVEAFNIFLEILDELWDIGLVLAERLVNSTSYINTEPVVVLAIGIFLFVIWLRH